MTETPYHRHTILRATLLVVLLAMAYGIGAAGISAHTSDAPCGLFEFPVIALGGAGGQVALEATQTEETSPALDTLIQSGRSAVVNHDWQKVLSLALSGLRCDSSSLQCHYLAAIAEREIGSGYAQQNVHWKMAQGHFEWILHRDSTFEEALAQYALLERNKGNRVRALELAQRQLVATPNNEAARIGLFRLLRHFLIAQSSEDFLSWNKGYSGAFFRFFEGEALRRAGRLSSADSVFTSLVGVSDGVPQEAVRLACARLCFMRGDYANAESEYMMAVQGLSSDVGAAILFDDLKYIMSDAELVYYRGLDSLRAKQDFFRNFWNFRNSTPALGTNPRLQEHIRRCLVAEKQYEYYGFRTWFSNPDNELTFPKAFALNEEFNDMGLIYLRQGAPDDIVRRGYGFFDDDAEEAGSGGQIVGYNPDAKEEYQSWLYDPTAESPRMIFHFQKHRSAGNNWRLTGYPTFDRMLRQLAVWDPTFERTLHARGGEVERAILETDVRSESKAVVNYALSTDKQTWDRKISTFRFPHAIDIFRAPDGQSLLDISYAIPTATLARLLPDTVHSVPVEIGFSLIDSKSHHAASELDTVNLDLSRSKTGAIVDLIRYTVPPDSYAVSMHIRPISGEVLGTWKQTLRVSDYSRPAFMMSSIQLLRPSPKKGALELDGVKVLQSPFRTHLRTEPLYIYFQIYNLIPDGDGNTSYATECRLLSSGEDDWDKGIVIHRKQKTGKEQMAVEFYTIDVRTISSGRYTLMMRVTDRKRVETIAATRDIEILKP